MEKIVVVVRRNLSNRMSHQMKKTFVSRVSFTVKLKSSMVHAFTIKSKKKLNGNAYSSLFVDNDKNQKCNVTVE